MGKLLNRGLVTEDDMKEAAAIITNEPVVMEDGNKRPRTTMDILQAFKSQGIRLAYIQCLEKSGISLDTLAQTAKDGLEAVKYDKNGNEVGPDYMARFAFWKELKNDIGMLQQSMEPDQGSIMGEQVIDYSNMSNDELEARRERAFRTRPLGY